MTNLSRKEKNILLLTTKEDITTDLIVVELEKQGANYIRLNCEDFPMYISMLWSPDEKNRIIFIKERSLDLNEVKSIWCRRIIPSMFLNDKISKEYRDFANMECYNFFKGYWETLNTFYVNKPSNISIAENKILQLSFAKKLGFQIPKTIISNNPRLMKKFVDTQESLIAKTISTGMLRLDNGNWGIYSHEIKQGDFLKDEEIQVSPFILQERVLKQAELRVTIVGKELFATKMILKGEENKKSDWRLADENYIIYEKHRLPKELTSKCFKLMNYFRLYYAAIDFLITKDGRYIFLEINPSGQWGWIENETGFPITKKIAYLLIKGNI